MTNTELGTLRKLIKKLNDCQEIADRLEITVGNGGEVGGLGIIPLSTEAL